MNAHAYRSQKEKTLFVLAAIFSSVVWLAVIISIVGLLYAPFVALATLVAHALFMAHIAGNGVRLGSQQLPEVYKRVQSAAHLLGMESVPEVYVVQAGGVLNAYATKLLSRQFVILNAEIVDACMAADASDDPTRKTALDFVIAHELGHLALGHLAWNAFLLPAQLVPLLGPAYSRAREYSCDACGAAVVDNLETSSRALAVLAAGGHQARHMNLDAFVDQRHDAGGFFMGLYELNTSHPYLTKRIAALRQAVRPGSAPAPGRNPLSYVFAPLFAMMMGGPVGAAMILVMYMGIFAAIAIPNFLKFQERAQAASQARSAIESASANTALGEPSTVTAD
jgi:Zn-dependent protease with chaperone function